MGDNLELEETLNDIESMAYLGRYYADKMRAAAKLAAFREDVRQKHYHAEAVGHLKDAVEEWKSYAAIVSSQYKPQLMARTHYMDWNALLKEVEQEVLTVQREGDYPEIRFANLKNGVRLPVGSDLLVEVEATDKDGIDELRVFLDGLLLRADTNRPQVWSGSSDELLRDLKAGMYHLEAVATDKAGITGRRAIQVAVGDASNANATDWREAIHQVILNEGEYLMDGESREFPRLNCYLYLNEDGRLRLNAGTRKDFKGMIWQASMHRDYLDPQYVALENGQLKIHRGTPGSPDATLFSTPPVAGPCPYQFAITVSRKLVVVRGADGKEREIVWRSH
jgi:hypothetical protein